MYVSSYFNINFAVANSKPRKFNVASLRQRKIRRRIVGEDTKKKWGEEEAVKLLRGICQSTYKPTQTIAVVAQEQTKKMGKREKLSASLRGIYQPARSPAEPPKVGATASVDSREKQCVASGPEEVKPLKGVHQPDEPLKVAAKTVGVKAQKVRWSICQSACLLNILSMS